MTACRVDANQAEIMDALRRLGCYVKDISRAARVVPGLPDLLVVKGSRVILGECKMPGEKLTPAQVRFWREYPGPIALWHSVDECLDWARNEGMIC